MPHAHTDFAGGGVATWQSEGLENEPSACEPEAVHLLISCLRHDHHRHHHPHDGGASGEGATDEGRTDEGRADEGGAGRGQDAALGSEPRLQCVEALHKVADKDPNRCAPPILTALQTADAALQSPPA